MYFVSDERLGADLNRMSVRSVIVTATKTAKSNTLESVSHKRKDLKKSTRNLKTDYENIYRLSHRSDDPDAIEASLLEMEQLKREGNIRSLRVSI